MKVTFPKAAAQRQSEFADPAIPSSPATSVPSMERRSPARRGSRGDKHRMSPSVIVNIVQASDLLLLLFCGLLGTSVMTLRGLHSDGSLFLATATASFVAAVFLSRADAYLLSSLRSLGKQLKLLPMPLLAGAGSMIVCLFLMRDDGLVFREWPFLWLFSSAVTARRIAMLSVAPATPVEQIPAGWPAGLQ